MNSQVDLIIVGGGPAGLFAAFYAGFRQMSVKIIDSLDVLGGQLITLYPEKYIYDVAGFPKVLAKDLANALIEQGLQYKPAVCLGQQVRRLTYDESTRVYGIETPTETHLTRSILIAAGLGAFVHKPVPLANAREYEGRGLYYSVQKLDDFRDKRVLIVGGGDSAVDWANALCPVAREVTLIHRRDAFRAHEDSVAKMRASSTRIVVFHELQAIGGDGALQWATIHDNRTKEERRLDLDAVLVNIGFVSSLGPIREWGLVLDGNSIRVDSTMQTNRPGIFAAGDVVNFPGKLKLIATGFGEAATAVNHAKNYLDPKARVFPGHSSEKVDPSLSPLRG